MFYIIKEEYEDRLLGYFDNESDAIKYCAYLNYKDKNSSYTKCNVEELQIDSDFLELQSKMKYTYTVNAVYDDKYGWTIKKTPKIGHCYFSEILKSDIIFRLHYECTEIAMNINIECENSVLAKTIAMNYLKNFKGITPNDNNINNTIELLNNKFKLEYNKKLERLRQERIKQEELAELARLKAKYESN